MKRKTRAIYILLILFFTIILDQVTKMVARVYLADYGAISFFHDIFLLNYTENRGGFLGMGSAVPEQIRFWIFTVSVALFLCFILVYLIFSKSLSNPQVIALSAVIGGGTGNLIDRLLREGRVVDFMNAGIGPVRTGIFNVADLFITFGAIFLLWLLLTDKRKKQKKTA